MLDVSDPNLDSLTQTALQAQEGDRDALERLCREISDPMYGLALRYSGNPTDAEDATHEVMIKIITGLSTFRAESRFTTWAYTVAVRQLLRTRQRPTEQSIAGSEPFAEFIDRFADNKPFEGESEVEYQELTADIRLACTYGMLLCLSRPVRVSYLLGDLLGFSDTECADILEISRPAHRKRLSRARQIMRSLLKDRCGLVAGSNPCHCSKLVQPSIDFGYVEKTNPVFARHRGVKLPISVDVLERASNELDTAVAAAEIYRDNPDLASPVSLWESLQEAMPELLK